MTLEVDLSDRVDDDRCGPAKHDDAVGRLVRCEDPPILVEQDITVAKRCISDHGEIDHLL